MTNVNDKTTGLTQGIQGGYISSNDEKQAKMTFFFDVAWAIANILFVIAWVKSIHSGGAPFSECFLQNGFCNAPEDSSFNTQQGCAFFDWTVAIATLIYLRVKGVSDFAATGNGVIYPIVHGLAHFSIFKDWVSTSDKITWSMDSFWNLFILSLILAMGPAAVAAEVNFKYNLDTPWERIALIFGTVALDVFLTKFFATNIQKGVFVLLYINVAINLLLTLSRAILFNPFSKDKDVAIRYRTKAFGPYFGWSMASLTTVIAVMWIEPTMCGTCANPEWFAKIGGHVWFDVSLFFMASVAIANIVSSGGADKALKAVRKVFHY